jgi:polyisoprenoid-binding protein YceI
MKAFIAFFILTLGASFASDCNYSINESHINWIAYKTPKKVGVGGKFSRHQLNTTPSSSVIKLVESATFSIDVSSIDTGNPARDKKIKDFFFYFNNKEVPIKGKVLSASKEQTKALLDINGVKKEVVFKNNYDQDQIVLESVIDVMDFNLSSNLKSIHKACEKLHEGKTWQDVKISILAKIRKQCT